MKKKQYLQIAILLYVVYYWLSTLYNYTINSVFGVNFIYQINDFLKLRNPFDMSRSWMFILTIIAIGLTIASLIKWTISKKIELNNYIKFPLFILFTEKVFLILSQLLQVNHLKDFIYNYNSPLSESQQFSSYVTLIFFSLTFVVLSIYAFRSVSLIAEGSKPVLNSKRIKNRMIDFGIIWIVTFRFMRSYRSGWILESIEWLNNSPIFIFTLYSMTYYIALEYTFGQTIGKIYKNHFVTGLEKNRFKAILIRTLCRLIPFEAFSFFSKPGKGWHDKFSKTNVSRKFTDDITHQKSHDSDVHSTQHSVEHK